MTNHNNVGHDTRRKPINCRDADSDTGSASADDVTRRCEYHVTGSAVGVASCVLVTLLLVLMVPVTGAVDQRAWYGGAARLDVKVYPQHSVLAAAQSVTVQCSVGTHTPHVHHRARLRVRFYLQIAEDTALPLSIEVPGIDIWAEPKSFHVRTVDARGRRGWYRQPDVRYLTVGKQAYRFLRRGDNHFFCAALEWRSGARGVGYFTVRKV